MSMNNFAKVAKRETTISDVMIGRELVKMDDIINNYHNGITVTEFDFITINGNTFPVLAFSEDQTKCFFGGTVLANICHAWTASYEGDIESSSQALAESGGVKMKFAKSRTKKGNQVTTVEIIE